MTVECDGLAYQFAAPPFLQHKKQIEQVLEAGET
jgi:hypothetical protein